MVLGDILGWFNKNHFNLCDSVKSSKTSLKIKSPQILYLIHPRKDLLEVKIVLIGKGKQAERQQLRSRMMKIHHSRLFNLGTNNTFVGTINAIGLY